jgi:hypothetical protein
LALFDAAPLNRRYWVSFVLLSALFVLEFFDFLIVGAAVAPHPRPIGGDSLQQWGRRDPGRACLWRAVRRLGTQDHDDHRHLHLRRELGD